MRKGISLFPAAMLAFMLFSCDLHAQFLVKPVDLIYLARRADIIVQGSVVEVLNESLPGYPNIQTIKVTLQIDKMMRGPQGSKYTFREILIGLRSREGKKIYRVGQQVLLFLPAPSSRGLSSPIGMEQGRFHITLNPAGKSVIANETGNAGLFKNVAQASSQAGRKLTKSQLLVAATEHGPVPLDDFVSMVNNLTILPRIQ